MQETFNQEKPVNKTEGLPQINVTFDDLRKEVAERKKSRDQLQAEKPASADEYSAFKYTKKINEANEAYRYSVTDVLAASPSVVTLNNNNKAYKDIFNGYQGNWKAVVNDPTAVALVKENSTIEKTALTPSPHVTTPEGDLDINLDISKAETDARKAETDALIARLDARNAAKKEGVQTKPLGSEVTVNTFTAEEQARKKAEWLRDNPQSAALDIDLAQMEKSASQKPKTPQNVDVNLGTLEDEAIERQRKLLVNAPKNPDERMILTPSAVKRTPGIALERDLTTSLAAAPQKMERITQVLEARKNRSKDNLEKMGANWLSKSLEAFKNVGPGYKIALGVTLAGASIATGGLTAILGAGIMKGMSSLSYGSAIYDKMLKAKQDRGLEVNKAAIATNALVLGIGAALATSWIATEVFSHIDVPEVLDTAKEKLVSMKDSVKGWWDSLVGTTPDVIPNTDFSTMPINGLTIDDGLSMNGTPTPLNEGISSPDVMVNPDSVMILPEYTVQPGDNLTKIIREHVLNTVPGVEGMSELQKNNMIENYLKGATKVQGAEFFNSVNQFADQSVIQPGAKIDLTQIRQGMMSFQFTGFNGETLYEHAQSITGGSPSGGVFSSGAPTPAAGASFTAQPLTQANPADFGATPQVTASPNPQSTSSIPEVGSRVNIPPRPLTPNEVIDLNDAIIDRNGAGGMTGREHISEA